MRPPAASASCQPVTPATSRARSSPVQAAKLPRLRLLHRLRDTRPHGNRRPGSCAVHYPNRGSQCGGNSAPYGSINFITGDTINGPLHSEDTLSICGNPVFGRAGDNDAVEAAAATGASAGWYPNGCTSTPVFNTRAARSTRPPARSRRREQHLAAGRDRDHARRLQLPWQDDDRAERNQMYVTNAAAGLNGTTPINDPTNGVIYVSTPTGAAAAPTRPTTPATPTTPTAATSTSAAPTRSR